MRTDPTGFRTVPQDGPGPFAFYRGTPACSTPTSARVGSTPTSTATGSTRTPPHLDPGRPARRELRHLPRRRRAPGLRRQRLRRGLPRALDLGPRPVRRQPCPALLAEGPSRRGHRGPRRALRARLRRTGRALPERGHDKWALTLDTAEGAARRAAPRQAVDALRDARVDDRGGGLPATLRGRLGRAPAGGRRGRAVGAAFATYLTVPDTHPGHGHVRRPRRGRSVGFRRGQRGPAGVQRPHRGFQPPWTTTSSLDEAGEHRAPSRACTHERGGSYFEHHGHRTAISQRPCRPTPTGSSGGQPARARRTAGVRRQRGLAVEADLAWDEVSEPKDLGPLVTQLGRATAKIHCVSDSESDQRLLSVEEAVASASAGTSTASSRR